MRPVSHNKSPQSATASGERSLPIKGPSTKESGIASSRFVLFRHDYAIVSAVARTTFGNLSDALTLLLGVPLLTLVVRAWIAGLASERVHLLAIAIGFSMAFAVAKFAFSRIEYHRTDGALTAFAFTPTERICYVVPIFAIGLAAGLAVVEILNLDFSALWMVSTLSGAAAGWAWPIVTRALRERRFVFVSWPGLGRSRRPWPMPVVAAIGAGNGIICALLPVDLPVAAAVTIASGIVASALLGRVDAAKVSYMTMVGHSSPSIIAAHLAGLLGFFIPFAAALAIAAEFPLTLIGALFAFAVPVFATMRILAYRSFGRRFADWVVTILFAITALIALSLPPVAPLFVLVSLIWLFRRAVSRTWLIT